MYIDTPEDIALFRLMSLRAALRLEIAGMKRRGRSAYSIIKEEFGFKGNRKVVYEQLKELIEKRKTE